MLPEMVIVMFVFVLYTSNLRPRVCSYKTTLRIPKQMELENELGSLTLMNNVPLYLKCM